LEGLLPRASLALRLPSTEAVELVPGRRCLRITVEDIETGRSTVLLLRGVGVPRRAVLLQLSRPDHRAGVAPDPRMQPTNAKMSDKDRGKWKSDR
jgi:hypothetical protein